MKFPDTDSDAQKPALRISRTVYDAIRKTVGSLPAESGGVFGMQEGDGTVRHFAFDATGRNTAASYSPDIERVNALFRNRWNPAGVRFVGFLHSHPSGFRQPSEGDRIYAERILRALPHLDMLQLPIAMSAAHGRAFEILPFVAVRGPGGRAVIETARLEIDDERAPAIAPAGPVEPATNNNKACCSVGTGSPAGPVDEPTPSKKKRSRRRRSFARERAFARVRESYDMDRLANSRVICVGCGGSASFIEDLARAGVGEFILVDPDRIGRENIATQMVRRSDVGLAKVEALKARLADINPRARVKIKKARAEAIPIETWRKWAAAPFLFGPAPDRTLLLGMTDNFAAQAQINRLALVLGVPSLSAQVYFEGRAAEITFTYPGVTPACHRCVLAPRYRKFEEGFKNPVGTAGAPIFATARLNALKGFVALAILHHGTNHARWGTLLTRIGNRNLIQIRMDPDLAATLGLTAFDNSFAKGDAGRILFDETLWSPQEPEPECPDCGGKGF